MVISPVSKDKLGECSNNLTTLHMLGNGQNLGVRLLKTLTSSL